MNELDVRTRMREWEAQVRRAETSAWQWQASMVPEALPRTGRAPGFRRAVGEWVVGLGTWIAGASIAPPGGEPAPRGGFGDQTGRA